jgi:hypothetical protein
MKIEGLIVDLTEEVWFKGTKDERKVKGLVLLDRVSCAGQKMKNTFDYTPSLEELAQLNISALDGQHVVIGVNDVAVNNGRMRVRGKLDMEALPAAVKLNGAANPNGVSTPVPQGAVTSGAQAKGK